MEDIIEINGIKYKKLEETSEVKNQHEENKNAEYEIIEFNGYEWYVIEKDEEKATLLMKNKFSKSEMAEIFDDTLLDNDYDVCFSFTDNNWRWADSPIRLGLNTKFLAKFNRNQLMQMTTTYELGEEESITRDYVRLLSKKEVDKLPMKILSVLHNEPYSSYGYWLGSPHSFFDGYAFVFGVDYANDARHGSGVSNSYGVRPVVSITLHTYRLMTKQEPSCEE